MKKLIAVLMFSSVLSVPAMASTAGNCHKAAWTAIQTDMGACKDIQAIDQKDACRKQAYFKYKQSIATCPAAAPAATTPAKAVVKDSTAN
jgi:hypothetical protein